MEETIDDLLSPTSNRTPRRFINKVEQLETILIWSLFYLLAVAYVSIMIYNLSQQLFSH